MKRTLWIPLALAAAMVTMAGLGSVMLRVAPRPPSPGTSAAAGAPAAPVSPLADGLRQRVVTLEIGGMVCAGCVAKISNELNHTPGVASADVSLQKQRASVVCSSSVSDADLLAAVRRAGPEYLGLIVKE